MEEPPYKEYKFEWDPEKAAINLKKHGVSFEIATEVFDDENRVEFFDLSHSDYEDRYITIGMVKNILSVVYTERGERIRLISARRATAQERRIYNGHGIL